MTHEQLCGAKFPSCTNDVCTVVSSNRVTGGLNFIPIDSIINNNSSDRVHTCSRYGVFLIGLSASVALHFSSSMHSLLKSIGQLFVWI